MRHLAFSFRSAFDLDAMRALLVAEGSLPWRGGDNDLWGQYLATGFLDDVRVRVFVDGERYVVDMSSALGGEAGEAGRAFVIEKLLPLVGAEDIQPHSGWE